MLAIVWKDVWNSYTTQNMLTLLLVGLLVGTIYWLSRQEHWRIAWRQVRSNRLAMVSLYVLMIYLCIGITDSIAWRDPARDEEGKIIRSPSGEVVYDPVGRTLFDRLPGIRFLREATEKTYSAPFSSVQFTREMLVVNGKPKFIRPKLKYPHCHPLGTDRVGRDVLWESLKSVRTGLVVGGITTLIAIPFALIFGILAGYFGGYVDDIIQYLYTTVACIPSVLLIAAFILLFGRGLFQLCLILGITGWTGLCRIVRGETLKLRELDYVRSAQATGEGHTRILLRHIVPNLMHIVLISVVLRFSGLVLAEAVLSYIGIGVDPATASWGNMINAARLELNRDPIVWWPLAGSFIFMLGLVLSANLFGDALRDALDPRLRTR